MYKVINSIPETKLEEILARADVTAGLYGIYPGAEREVTIGHKDRYVGNTKRPIKEIQRTFTVVYETDTEAPKPVLDLNLAADEGGA